MKSIWIIEDHSAFRRTLVRVLNAEDGLQCTRDFDSCERLSLHSRGMTRRT